MIFVDLFLTFLKIGIFSFGGGYSMVALIQDEVVNRHRWMSVQEFADLVAISQMTPGPIGINSATYAGYTAVLTAGYPQWAAVGGALTASLAVVLLPVTLVLTLTRWLTTHRSTPWVESLLKVLRLTVVGLIAATALSLMTAESFGTVGLNVQFLTSVLIFAAVFLLNLRRKTSPIALIVGAGLTGLVVYSL